MIQRDNLPATPDWHTDPRAEPDFTRAIQKDLASSFAKPLCQQTLDGRGDQ